MLPKRTAIPPHSVRWTFPLGDPMLSLIRPTIRPVHVVARTRDKDTQRNLSRPICKITYRYADAGNWKFWGEFCVLGTLRFDDLRPHLFDEEFFIPERIGVPSLVPDVKNDDGHLLHTFQDFAVVDSAPCVWTVEELVERVRLANKQGWFAGIY
jgi:hypothetical protein